MKKIVALKVLVGGILVLSLNGCLGGDNKKDTFTQTQGTTVETDTSDIKTDDNKTDTPNNTTDTNDNNTSQTVEQPSHEEDTSKPTETNTTTPTVEETNTSTETTTETNTTTPIPTTETNTTEEPNTTTPTTEETNTSTQTQDTNESTPTTETNTATETNTTTQTNSLTLSSPKTNPLKDKSITLTIKDSKDKTIDSNITWIVNPTNSIKQSNTNIITPIQDTTITLKAKYNNKLSNPITLHVKWIVNGHTLPPEPDENINNSTLLGVDVNNNDVRDDVERWIYETYKDKHPVHIDIAMQAGRAFKKVLQMPERALEIHDEVDASIYCEEYYSFAAKLFKESILVEEDADIDSKITNKYFNTKQRYSIYRNEYDKRLSGHVFMLPNYKDEKSYCDFNTSKYDKK